MVGLFAVPGNGDDLLLLIYLDFDLVREVELRVCGSFPGRVGAEVNVFCNDRGDFLCRSFCVVAGGFAVFPCGRACGGIRGGAIGSIRGGIRGCSIGGGAVRGSGILGGSGDGAIRGSGGAIRGSAHGSGSAVRGSAHGSGGAL